MICTERAKMGLTGGQARSRRSGRCGRLLVGKYANDVKLWNFINSGAERVGRAALVWRGFSLLFALIGKPSLGSSAGARTLRAAKRMELWTFAFPANVRGCDKVLLPLDFSI